MDTLSSEQRQSTMRRVRSQNTKPELLVRRLVYGMGYRYRLHRKDLPGKPDMVFFKRKKVIFIHGCFWHGHSCKAGLNTPRSNQSYWLPKLARNRARDHATQVKLEDMGWHSLTLWECQLKETVTLKQNIQNFLEAA